MPFRDRVARRFGETVSAPVSDQIPLRCAVSLDQSPCSLPLLSGSDKVYDDGDDDTSLRASLANPTITISVQIKTTARHYGKNTGAGRGERGDAENIVREGLSPRHRGAQRVIKHSKKDSGTKRRGVKTRTTTTGSSVEVRDPARRTTATACGPVVAHAPEASSNRLDTGDASADEELVEILGNGRSSSGRVTRASSRQIMTDRYGEQLSPTSPYLSCEYPSPLCTKCDDIVLTLPPVVHDVCRTQSSSTYSGSLPPNGTPTITNVQQLPMRILRL